MAGGQSLVRATGGIGPGLDAPRRGLGRSNSLLRGC
jgi:hypothetical protein